MAQSEQPASDIYGGWIWFRFMKFKTDTGTEKTLKDSKNIIRLLNGVYTR